MKASHKAVIKSFSYSAAANLVSAIVSGVLVLIVPKLLDTTNYGYWQFSLFLGTYVGYFHFGLADGVYLRYGGIDYNKLDKKNLFSQFWFLFFMEIVVAICIIGISWLIEPNADKKLLFLVFAFSCILQLPATYLRLILQTTGRVEVYAKNILVEKLSYGLFVIGLLLIRKDYKILLIADILSKIVSLVQITIRCNDIVIIKGYIINWKSTLKEAYENLNIGSKLLIANLSSALIVGIIRIIIENVWSIEIFGKISLTLNVSSLLMILINAVSVVMFPLLKRMKEEEWSNNYQILNLILLVLSFTMLLCFFPLKLIFDAWLPNYREGLKYMAILFPMCIYEGKTSMLLNTYLKALRKEKQLLFINVISLLVSCALSSISAFILHNLSLTVISIVISLCIRCLLAEFVLSKYIEFDCRKNLIIELLIPLIFITSNWCFTMGVAFVIYLLVYLIYLYYMKNELKKLNLFAKKIFNQN